MSIFEKPIHISPPFGNYYVNSRVTSVLGSYTLLPRPGRGLKVAQFALDNLIHPVDGGWRNRIGLRNPGLDAVAGLWNNVIYSLVGIELDDWKKMLYILLEKERFGAAQRLHVELNVSCPNVHEYSITRAILEQYVEHFDVTVKVPPIFSQLLPISDMCHQAGVHYLHCSNTIPSELGGLSGYPLKLVNLPIVERMAKEWTLVAGGGIYSFQDLLDYAHAGATYFSISTLCFYPWRVRKLINEFYNREDEVYGI